jgi:hypothetical protein
MVKIDITDTFIQTPMQGKITYMRVDQKTTHHVVEMYPDLMIWQIRLGLFIH